MNVLLSLKHAFEGGCQVGRQEGAKLSQLQTEGLSALSVMTYSVQGSTASSREFKIQVFPLFGDIGIKDPFQRHIANHEDNEAAALKKKSRWKGSIIRSRRIGGEEDQRALLTYPDYIAVDHLDRSSLVLR